MYIPVSIKGYFGNWALGIWAYGTHCNELLERPPNNSFPARNYTMPKARIRYPQTSNANLLIQLAILVKHQIIVLKHYERQFFESLTLPLRELYGCTEIYRRVIDSKIAFFSFLFLLFLCMFVFQAFKNHLITAKPDESYCHCECTFRLQKFAT